MVTIQDNNKSMVALLDTGVDDHLTLEDLAASFNKKKHSFTTNFMMTAEETRTQILGKAKFLSKYLFFKNTLRGLSY